MVLLVVVKWRRLMSMMIEAGGFVIAGSVVPATAIDQLPKNWED